MFCRTERNAYDQTGYASRTGSGSLFSKVPQLFGRISGDMILFVSSKRRRLRRHETLQLLLFSLQHIKGSALRNKRVGVLQMAFRTRKVFGTFEKLAPGTEVARNRQKFGLFHLRTS